MPLCSVVIALCLYSMNCSCSEFEVSIIAHKMKTNFNEGSTRDCGPNVYFTAILWPTKVNKLDTHLNTIVVIVLFLVCK